MQRRKGSNVDIWCNSVILFCSTGSFKSSGLTYKKAKSAYFPSSAECLGYIFSTSDAKEKIFYVARM